MQGALTSTWCFVLTLRQSAAFFTFSWVNLFVHANSFSMRSKRTGNYRTMDSAPGCSRDETGKTREKVSFNNLGFPNEYIALQTLELVRSFRAHPRQVICYFHSRFPGCARVFFFLLLRNVCAFPSSNLARALKEKRKFYLFYWKKKKKLQNKVEENQFTVWVLPETSGKVDVRPRGKLWNFPFIAISCSRLLISLIFSWAFAILGLL